MRRNSGAVLYEKAKTLIPGGNQLLSKRPEMFLPNQWPSYYSKCKGVDVWDLDGNKYIDMTTVGIGACILGYADKNVDQAVINAIDCGSMCTLNCPEEVELAELLCQLHPWAEMARYTRTGGEALAVAIRIARAATGKAKVLFCGYHGWHDWYLSANLGEEDRLDGHLLPGLAPAGVPRNLKDTVIPFAYNRTDQFNKLVEKYSGKIAAIIAEPVRHSQPKKGFLQNLRDTANKIDAVLIFDEVTSGWRMKVGGIHLLYAINPDIAVFAKGMSNGYPMGAIIGTSAVMQAAQKSFISSTYWTERIGPSAALATIKKMLDCNVPDHLCKIGNELRVGLTQAAHRHSLPLKIHGIPPLTIISFDCGEQAQPMRTLFTQEMLKRGILAAGSFYSTYSHQSEHIKIYLDNVDEVFSLIAEACRLDNLGELLAGPTAHVGFKRLA